MHACYSRHRALAFGGRKSGSGIKVGKLSEDDNPLSTIIENSDYVGEEERISKDVIKEIIKVGKKINTAAATAVAAADDDDTDHVEVDDVENFDQFSVGILS